MSGLIGGWFYRETRFENVRKLTRRMNLEYWRRSGMFGLRGDEPVHRMFSLEHSGSRSLLDVFFFDFTNSFSFKIKLLSSD